MRCCLIRPRDPDTTLSFLEKNLPAVLSLARKDRLLELREAGMNSRQSMGLKLMALGDEGLSERELRKLMLMVLYDVRRNTPGNPQVSMLVLAELLGCSIENLEFSNWYLKEKGYIRISESADFSITIAGVDYVESELAKTESGKQVLSLPEGHR